MAHKARPIKDSETGQEYRSMYAAGKALASAVGGDPANRLVWFAVARKFPGRFQTKDPETGEWIGVKEASRRRQKKAGDEPAAQLVSAPTPQPTSQPSAPQEAGAVRSSMATTRTGAATSSASKSKSKSRVNNMTTSRQNKSKRAAR
jgi:hypothetical protein